MASNVCYPGEQISTEVPQDYGCWYATAWLIGSLESGDSGTVCKRKPVCMSCHSSDL